MNKIKKVLSENVKTTLEIREFFQKVLLDSIEKNVRLPHSFVEALTIQGVSEVMVENYLNATPRLICDFLDEHDIIILITYHGNQGFSFVINGEPHEKWYDSRRKAELESVIEGIEYYEKFSNEKGEEK